MENLPKNEAFWKEELKKALRTHQDIEEFFQTIFPKTPYGVFLPLPFAQKIKEAGPSSPLWKEFLPQEEENQSWGILDPIGDHRHLKAPQLIHRYPNRVLFLPTQACPVSCRYCFRKNELSHEDQLFKSDFEKTMAYMTAHPEIHELIFSGGDPLMLSEDRLDYFLKRFSEIPNLHFIRFHTRMPIVLPSRLDESFIDLIKKYSSRFQMILALHINHKDEWSLELEENLKPYLPLVTLLSQTVLLMGINDQQESLNALFLTLTKNGIRPYYLHHPDQVRGGQHFYLSLEEGRRLYLKLRLSLPGWAIPHYVIDIPEGDGKTLAFNPEKFEYSGSLLSPLKR